MDVTMIVRWNGDRLTFFEDMVVSYIDVDNHTYAIDSSDAAVMASEEHRMLKTYRYDPARCSMYWDHDFALDTTLMWKCIHDTGRFVYGFTHFR